MTIVNIPFEFVERAAFVPETETLIVADLHLGRAAASSVDVPIDDGGDVIGRLEGLLERVGPERVVVAGDLLHSFSSIPVGVEREVATLESIVEAADSSLVVTPGNHDAMLEEVYDGETATECRLDDDGTVVLHGHEPPETKPTDGRGPTPVRYVVGHDHPAVSIGGRKRPCFLYGPGAYDGADVLMIPSFTRLAPGVTVNGMSGSDFQSPLVRDTDVFFPGIRDEDGDETLWFPPLGECRRLL